MRAKVAKALRRQARAATEGNPAVAYLSKQNVTTKTRGNKRYRITSEEIRLDPNSTKGHYRQLKKAYKAGGSLGA